MSLKYMALLAFLATPALAQDDIAVDVTYDSYVITGETLDDLKSAMTADGPNGYWAYTVWQVDWTGDCALTVTATITLPELDDTADLDDADIAEFDRMVAALEAHELGHVDFGIGFAEEVRDAGCDVDAAAVQAPYIEAEKQYDVDTEHGYTQGVYLGEG